MTQTSAKCLKIVILNLIQNLYRQIWARKKKLTARYGQSGFLIGSLERYDFSYPYLRDRER
ncbi:MAG: hypothetical protein A2Y81_06695 [Nitrospirae bacterium RBG_13_43_8]|nr:MAG: hypothetical protein A2Y81_06695 [Nitrospirae bacterium RBG_13_43_8]